MTGIADLLGSHSFRELFQQLGWDPTTNETCVSVDGQPLHFKAVGQKRGLTVLHCRTDRVNLADRMFLRHAQRRVLKLFHEHILVYTSDEPRKQVWQWAVRLPDGHALRHREHPFFSADPPAPFVARLEQLRFTLEEEESTTLLDALARVRAALDVSAEYALFVKRPRLARLSDELARLIQAGDEAAYHRLILQHLSLARSISRRLQRWFGMDRDDAEQTAVLGLLTAAQKFKPEEWSDFSKSATWWICNLCRRLGLVFALPIRIPEYVFWPCFRLQQQLDLLANRQLPDQERGDILTQLERDQIVSKNWRDFLHATTFEPLSRTGTLAASATVPEEDIVQSELNTSIREAIAGLRRRDAAVIRMRYGIDCLPMTLEAIGRRFRLTREAIRQMQLRAERRLRWRLKTLQLLEFGTECNPPSKD